MCNESLFYVVFYDKTSVYTTFKFLKNEIKYPVSCMQLATSPACQYRCAASPLAKIKHKQGLALALN